MLDQDFAVVEHVAESPFSETGVKYYFNKSNVCQLHNLNIPPQQNTFPGGWLEVETVSGAIYRIFGEVTNDMS